MDKVIDEDYLDLLIDNTIVSNYGSAEDITPINTTHSMLHVLTQGLDLCDIAVYPYQFFPSIFTLNSSASIEKSGIARIQENANFGLFGQGVLVAVIDTGIDYRHEAFINSDNTTKIIALWDQTINENNTPPSNFTYGSEYNSESINLALSSEDPLSVVPSVDEIGHGTMLASIIAGNENLNKDFRGVVPLSELVVVKMKQAKRKNLALFSIREDCICYQETDILAAVYYVETVAKRLRRPISICISIGTSQGAHDERGITSSYLDNLAQRPWFGVTIAGGNEGNKGRHFLGRTGQGTAETQTMELKVSNKDKKFAMELWQRNPDRLALSMVSPTGEIIPNIYPELNECRKFDFIFEPSIVYINNFVSESQSGDQLILVRFENVLEGVWKFELSNVEGNASSFNVWLQSGDIISTETFFLASNPNTTLTSPANTIHPITVVAYNQSNDAILIESSRGYTRNNNIKPDMAAPGFEIVCALPDNRYGVMSDTSAAAAHTTGIVAMILEWAVIKGNYPFITGFNINRLLIRGARRKSNLQYPNQIWGYGEIDIYGLFIKLI